MTKHALEDLYLPYKPKRRTRAQVSKEKGLEPLASYILEQNPIGLYEQAQLFICEAKGVKDIEEAIGGACDIIAEMISENADIRSFVRDYFEREGEIVSKAISEKITQPTKFEMYYDFREKIATIPSHRYLAIRRGEKEEVLQLSFEVEAAPILEFIQKKMCVNLQSDSRAALIHAIEDSYKRLISPSIETEIRVNLKMRSDESAVNVFAENLRHLLLSSPLGQRGVIGIDPGLRTGCKCAVVDATGKFLEHLTIFISQGPQATEKAKRDLLELIKKHLPFAISIGNGTAGRETEAFVKLLLRQERLDDIIVVSVSEAGASVYSASEIAREEFPDLDLTIRGAISIARRLQDPLAELVKVDPKSIGVGQYQHDVYQPMLQDKLDYVVESCVNHVGVELNTASAPLLARVAGIGPSLALKIVKHRERNGAFKNRKQLLNVAGIGEKTFQQSAGFLRIRSGEHPLDASAVHPERYELVENIAKDLGVQLHALIGNSSIIDTINARKYTGGAVGELTLKDIIEELKKPGRDPREVFERPVFREDVKKIEDLSKGMRLEGIITNVTAFGAFVDIGVHQDGLIHISELTNRFIKDPSEVVKTGDKIHVEVLDVDLTRSRIALTARVAEGAKTSIKPLKEMTGNLEKKNLPKKPFRKAFQASPFDIL